MWRAGTSLALLLTLSLLPVAQAATHTVKLSYWPTSLVLSGVDFPGTFATWNTVFWELSYMIEWDDWDLDIQYATGSQSAWTGTSAGTTSGTDTIWGLDISRRYEFQLAPLGTITAHAFAGYGSLEWKATAPSPPLSFTSSGFRFGSDFRVPIPTNPDWSFYTKLALYPSNSASRFDGTSTTTASSSARDWTVSVIYQPDSWFIEIGHRTASFDNGEWSGLSTSCPCTSQWSGWFLGGGWTW